MPRKHAQMSRYWEVTQRIVEALKNGTPPWRRTWYAPAPANAVTGRAYRGINRLLLEMTALECGFTSNCWVTFPGAKAAGGHVRQGETGTMVIFYDQRPKSGTAGESWDQEVEEEWLYVCRHYWLWNLDQCAGLDALRESSEGVFSLNDVESTAQKIVQDTGAEITHGSEKAAYMPRLDRITMPHKRHFTPESAYWPTVFHELSHWTGHTKRLNRQLTGRFGEPEYAAEELIAELSAAFLCGEAGLAVETDQHAAYLGSWLSLLEGDCRAIFTAAREAQRASDFILGRTEGEETHQTTDDQPEVIALPQSA